MIHISIRCYEELNDFLHHSKRKVRFEHFLKEKASIKDVIESLGVPHTEVDLILVNNSSVNFEYLVEDGDDISVYPVFESFDIGEVQHLRPKPLRKPKFVLDVHLGKLAKFLRILGIDTAYEKNYLDYEIIDISVNEKRTILTRDLGILKHGKVTHGYFVRNTKSEKQLEEILERFQLDNEIDLFSRCLVCNSFIRRIEKEEITDRLPPKVRRYHEEFYYCDKCDKVYWKGSHYIKMKELVSKYLKE